MESITEHYFDWPAEKVIGVLRTGEDLCEPETLSNVSARKVIEFKREGDNFRRKCEWCVHGQIPRAAQKLLTPEMLTFIEDTLWEDAAAAFHVKIIPHYLKKFFSMTNTSIWSEAGPGRTRRRLAARLDIRIPIIGPLLEKTILSYMEKNNDENAEGVRAGLEARFGPPAAG